MKRQNRVCELGDSLGTDKMTNRHPTANTCQRARRARYPRIDYYPSHDALAIVKAKLGPYAPINSYTGVLDAIVNEWAELTGINKREIKTPMTAARTPELSDALRAGAYDFGADLPIWGEAWLAANRAKLASRRVICGARRHRDGQPCRAMSEPGKRRCKWHGGCSTGPRSAAGKVRALANLKQNHRKAPSREAASA